jgi:hypothetical protein
MSSRLFLLYCLVTLSLGYGLSGEIIYVDKNYNSASQGDGSSWEKPYKDLHTAFNRSADGDVIKVAVGVYLPPNPFFSILRQVRIIGGFRTQYSGSSQETILDGKDSGEIQGRVIRAVDGVIFENLTIKNSRLYMSGFTSGYDPNDPKDRGGGIYVMDDGTIKLFRCKLMNNYANYGGAIYGNVIAVDTLFEENEARYDGSAIAGEAHLINCVFKSNIYDDPQCSIVTTRTPSYPDPSNGGPSLNWSSKKLSLINCVFWKNESYHLVQGSLIDVYGSVFAENMGNCIFVQSGGYASIRNCTFSKTRGASANSSTVYAHSSSYVEIKNSIIDLSVSGNGIYKYSTGGTPPVVVEQNNRTFNYSALSDLVNPNLPFGFTGEIGDSDDGIAISDDSSSVDGGTDIMLPTDKFDYDEDGNVTENIAWDIWGNNRIQGEAIDVGAYETGNNVISKFLITLNFTNNGLLIGGGEKSYNERVSISAVPQKGYTFDSWIGDINSSDNPLSFLATENLSVSANFTEVITNSEYLTSIATSRTEGEQSVLDNPSAYNLFTSEQYEEALQSQDTNATPYTPNWFYIPDQGWMWTQKSTYPYFYDANSSNWMYFQSGHENPRFYHYGTKEWMTLE